MSALSQADFYRKLHTGNPGDLEFYRRVVAGTSSVLELGCGSGRILLGIGEPGMRIVGVDDDANFIAQARKDWTGAEPAQFLVGDICDSTFSEAIGPEKFERVLIPYNTLYALGGLTRVQSCITLAAHHLSEDGELWLDVYPMDELQAAIEAGEELIDDDGKPVAVWEDNLQVYETTVMNSEQKHLKVTYEARSGSGPPLARLEMNHDYFITSELRKILGTAGLDPIAEFGSFDGDPLDQNTSQVIFGAAHKE